MTIPDLSSIKTNTLESFQLPSRRFVVLMIIASIVSIVSVCLVLINLHYRSITTIRQENLNNLLHLEGQLTQHVLQNINEVLESILFDLQQENVDVDITMARYQTILNHMDILDNLVILKSDQDIVWSYQPIEQLPTNLITTLVDHPSSSSSKMIYHFDLDDRSTDNRLIYASYSNNILANNGDDYLAIVVISAQKWSTMITPLITSNNYNAILFDTSGNILTTLPYTPKLVGYQISDDYRASLPDNAEEMKNLPSLMDNTSMFMKINQLDDTSINILVEFPNPFVSLQFDLIIWTVVIIGSLTIIGGTAILILYLRQHQALSKQTDQLYQTSLNLQKEIEFHSTTETSLRESEERHRIISEMISDGAFKINVLPDGNLTPVWYTSSIFRNTIYDEDNLPDILEIGEATHPDDQERESTDMERVFAGETVTSIYRKKDKVGNYHWIETTRQPIWGDKEGRVTSYYGVSRDVTEQKEIEIALKESEERYRLVSELISDFAFSIIVNKDGTFEVDWITDSFYTISGYEKKADVMEVAPLFQTHPDDQERVQRDFAKTLEGNSTLTEYRWKVQSGDYLWIRVKRHPIWSEEEKRLVQIIGACHNINAEKEAEIALKQSEERYRLVSNILTDFAYQVYVNTDQSIIVEWTLGNLENIHILDNQIEYMDQVALPIHPDDEEKVINDLQETLKNIKTTTYYRVQTKNEYRWVQSVRQPIWDEDEERVVRILGTIKDITTEKEAESALAESQQRYRELTELMSDYAFSVTFNDDQVRTNWVVGSVEQITGISVEKVRSDPTTLATLTYADDLDLLQHDLEKSRQGHKTTTEYRIIHAKTGQIRWLRVSRQPIWDKSHEKVVRVIAGATDITAEKEAELALKENEDRYRRISQLISDYVFSIKLFEDFSTEIEWEAGSFSMNSDIQFADIFPLDQGSVHNIHPDDYTHVLENIWSTNYGETTVTEYRVVSPSNNTTHWLRVSRQPIWDEEQERVTRIIGAVSDVTIQKSTESALRESEERYRQATELISDYVYSLTVLPDNRLKMDWFAGSFKQITGVEIQEFIVENPIDMIQGAHPDDYDDAVEKIKQTMEGHATVSEYRITNAVDKQYRWIRASRYPITDQNDTVIRILGAVTDITGQKLAEAALRDSEERYRMLTELITDYAFSIRVEADGRLYREWLIGDAETILGYDMPSSGYLDEINTDHFEEEKFRYQAAVDRTIKGETTVAEYEVNNTDSQKTRWIKITRQPIWNKEHTRVIRYIGTAKDITLEKEADFVKQEADELRQALEREKSLHALRSRFVAMVTHEFRNPLAAILSSVSILDKYNHRLTSESRREKYERIYGQIERITNLLEDLLELGELEHRALKFSPKRTNIVTIVQDLYKEYAESIGKNHMLTLNTSRDSIYTSADEQILRQALGNIISNAIKYSPEQSEVICDIAIKPKEIVIQIIDKGVGIPKEDRSELFQAFFRASNVSTQPGTGLGLVIAKQAIELHNGTISFTTQLGKGTTFTIHLPYIIGIEAET